MLDSGSEPCSPAGTASDVQNLAPEALHLVLLSGPKATAHQLYQ